MGTDCQHSALPKTHPADADTHTETFAIVRAITGEDAIVEIESTGCGRCHEPGGCGGQSLTHLFAGNSRQYQVRNTCAAQPGERVSLQITRATLHQTANHAYVIPLLALILCALLGNVLAGDPGAIAGGGCGLILGWYGLRRWTQQGQQNAAVAGNASRHRHLTTANGMPTSSATPASQDMQMVRMIRRL